MLIEGSDLRLDISSPLFPEWCCSAQMEVLGIAYPVTHGRISWLLPVFSNHERTNEAAINILGGILYGRKFSQELGKYLGTQLLVHMA